MPSQKSALRFVLWASIASCVGGVAIAVLGTGEAADGGRGGAVAVALSFGALFAARDIPERTLFATRAGQGKPIINDDNELADTKLGVLRTTLAAMLDAQSLEKRYLTASSVIGTLTWGFGDGVARWFGAAG